MSIEVSLLNNGDLAVTTSSPVTIEQVLDVLDLSKEKKKHVQLLKNGTPITSPAEIIEPADRFTVAVDDAFDLNENTQLSYEGGVPVAYEDDWVLAANKKPFMLVHGDGHTADSLTARVNAHLLGEGWRFAAQPVNRIDQEASGLVLFAKHPLVKAYLDSQFEDGTAKKEYLAVVDGRIDNREIDINNPISRNRHDAEKMMVFRKGKPAHTHISRLKLFDDKTLVKADISTGRRHQIRVHLANIGYPIMNDPLYGLVRNKKGLMLQAWKLRFLEPFTHQPVEVELDMDTRFKWFDPSLVQSSQK